MSRPCREPCCVVSHAEGGWDHRVREHREREHGVLEVSNVRAVPCHAIQLSCQPCFVPCRAVPVYLNHVMPCRADLLKSCRVVRAIFQSCRAGPGPFT